MRMENGGEIFHTAFIQRRESNFVEDRKNKWESKSENKMKGMKWAEREERKEMETLE